MIVFARGLPDKLHTRIYLPERRGRAGRRSAAVVARRGRARYAHRDAHARRRPSPRHPAAGREGDRVPCLLTTIVPGDDASDALEAGLLSPVTARTRRVASDDVVLRHLVEAEVALGRALVRGRIAPRIDPGSARRRGGSLRGCATSTSPRLAARRRRRRQPGHPADRRCCARGWRASTRMPPPGSTAGRRARTSSTPRS